MPTERTYETAVSAWPDGPLIEIESNIGTRIALLPLKFLETCGDNTWSYVSYVISLLVVADPEHPGGIIDPHTGLPVDPAAPPTAGIYTFIEQGKQGEVTFGLGPTSAISVISATGIEESSRGTSSSGSATEQVTQQKSFRDHVLVRDRTCIVSGKFFTSCQASHIVPWNRTDVYKRIDGHDQKNFRPKAGMLLETNLHHAYDALRWSLYYKDGVFYVHFFLPMHEGESSLHGKAIPL